MGPGDVLDGRYRLISRRGRGGFGTVWEADDTRGGGRVAVKVLHLDGDHPEAPAKARARFAREVATISGLKHPHIVTVHRTGEARLGGLRVPYLVMELLDGQPLSQVLADGLPPLNQALTWAEQIRDALHTAHQAGIAHRDLKPANVIVHPTRGVTLIDFGIASVDGQPGLTTTGVFIGSLPYMAPERFSGSGDHRADWYALGCLLTTLITGRPPFTGEGPALMNQHASSPPPVPSGRRPGLPVGLDRLVTDLLAKDPDQRPTSNDIHKRLKALTAPSPAARATPPRPAPADRRLIMPSAQPSHPPVASADHPLAERPIPAALQGHSADEALGMFNALQGLLGAGAGKTSAPGKPTPGGSGSTVHAYTLMEEAETAGKAGEVAKASSHYLGAAEYLVSPEDQLMKGHALQLGAYWMTVGGGDRDLETARKMAVFAAHYLKELSCPPNDALQAELAHTKAVITLAYAWRKSGDPSKACEILNQAGRRAAKDGRYTPLPAGYYDAIGVLNWVKAVEYAESCGARGDIKHAVFCYANALPSLREPLGSDHSYYRHCLRDALRWCDALPLHHKLNGDVLRIKLESRKFGNR